MSLAHLREMQLDRNRKTTGAAAAPKTVTSPRGYCGATREPVYRTMDEATASGLELCDSCLALFRQHQKGH